MTSLIARVRAEHECRPGATSEEIAEAEHRLGYSFTEELREFLSACNGVEFWKDGDYPCRFLSAGEIQPARVLLETDEGSPALIAIVEADGDFVAIDLEPTSKSYSRVIDCFHETFPHELFGICNSLPELLTLILDSKGQEWAWPAARAYGIDFSEQS